MVNHNGNELPPYVPKKPGRKPAKTKEEKDETHKRARQNWYEKRRPYMELGAIPDSVQRLIRYIELNYNVTFQIEDAAKLHYWLLQSPYILGYIHHQ